MRVVILVGLLAVGCGLKLRTREPEPVRLNENRWGIECHSLTQCYKLGYTACPSGFDVVDSTHRNLGSTSFTTGQSSATAQRTGPGSAQAQGSGMSTTFASLNSRDEMIIECKPPPYTAPVASAYPYTPQGAPTVVSSAGPVETTPLEVH